MRKKLLALALTLALVVSLCPATLAASPLKASEATTEVERRLAEIQTQKGFRSGDTSTNCFTFAQSVFEKIFGYKTNTLYYCGKLKSNGANLVRVGRLFVPRDGCSCDDPSLETDPTPISADTVKTLLSKAKCGDIIQTLRFNSMHEGCAISQPHTLLVQSVGQDSIVTYEGNISDRVIVRSHTYAEMAKSYTHAITLYRANNYDKVNGSSNTVTIDPALSTLEISPSTEPGFDLPQGKPFYFKGKITSNYPITSATISILSADGKSTILQTRTINPNTTTVDIATSGLDALKFGQLEPGSYRFQLIAYDQSGRNRIWMKYFSIAGTTPTTSPSTPAPSTPAPSTLTISPTTQPNDRMVYQTPFSFEGTITSNYNISYVYAAVKDRETSRPYLTRDDSPLVTKYDIKTSILNDLRLDQFALGRYTLEVIAKDVSGKEVRWQKDFSIERATQSAPSQQPSAQKPAGAGHTLTINYYIDNKLVFTDHSPDGNSEAAYIYEIPEAYRDYSFWYSSTNPTIGVFRTELWIAEQGSDGTIDLYANSDGSKPDQFLNSYEVAVISVNEAGTVLGKTSISTVEGDKCYYRPMDYAGYELARCDGDYSDCTFDSALGLLKIPAVYQDGTVTLVYRKIQSEPETTTSPAPTPTGSLSNFHSVNSYYSGLFYDVSSSDWFDENVKRAYELGLMKGMSEDAFGPTSSVTVAQAITLAARLHSIYYTGSENFVQSGSNWYDVYVTYARDNGILQGVYNYNYPISRGDFAHILAKAFPSEALPVIDSDIYFDDVKSSTPYKSDIYLLAQAGIIRGASNAFGTLDFSPSNGITRAEVAAIVTRMADPTLR